MTKPLRTVAGEKAQHIVKRAFAFVALALLTAGQTVAQGGGATTAQPRSSRPRPPVGAPAVTPAATASANNNAPLIGTLGPAATAALNQRTQRPTGTIGQGIAPSTLSPAKHRPLGIGAYVPLSVIDAPAFGRGSSTLVIAPVSPQQVAAPAFYPTTEPPTWRLVPEDHPVDAWRLLDVEDTVCDGNGACSRVRTRLQARWAPALRAYAFRDRIGRIWQVE